MVFVGLFWNAATEGIQLLETNEADWESAQPELEIRRDWTGNDPTPPCLFGRYIGIDLMQAHARWLECEATGHWGGLNANLMRRVLACQASALVELNAEAPFEHKAYDVAQWRKLMDQCLRKKVDEMIAAIPDSLSHQRERLNLASDEPCFLFQIIHEETSAMFRRWDTYQYELDEVPPAAEREVALDQPNTFTFAIKLFSLPFPERAGFMAGYTIQPGVGFVPISSNIPPSSAPVIGSPEGTPDGTPELSPAGTPTAQTPADPALPDLSSLTIRVASEQSPETVGERAEGEGK